MAEHRGPQMQSLEERVAYLEGRAEDHGTAMAELKIDLRDFRSEVGLQFRDFRSEVGREFSDFRSDVGQQFRDFRSDVGQRFGDTRGEISSLRGEIRGLRGEMNQRFVWLVGIQVTSVIALFSAIVGLYLR